MYTNNFCKGYVRIHPHNSFFRARRLCTIQSNCAIRTLSIYLNHYVGLFVLGLLFYLVMLLWMCVLYLIVIIKSEVCIISHCFWLDREITVWVWCIALFVSIIYCKTQPSTDRCFRSTSNKYRTNSFRPIVHIHLFSIFWQMRIHVEWWYFANTWTREPR